jgi:hypothetical protein
LSFFQPSATIRRASLGSHKEGQGRCRGPRGKAKVVAEGHKKSKIVAVGHKEAKVAAEGYTNTYVVAEGYWETKNVFQTYT